MSGNVTLPTTNVVDEVTKWVISVYMIFGYTGNPLVIYRMTRPELRNISLFRYLAAASFFAIRNKNIWVYNLVTNNSIKVFCILLNF